MLPIDQLIKPVTEDEVKSTIYSLLSAVGVNATAWKTGGVARTIVAVTSKVVSGFTQVMSTAVKATFLDTAEGQWLTLLARFVYSVERIPATFATGQVVLDNDGGGLYEFAAGELVVQNSSTGKTYKNVAAFTLSPAQQGLVVDIIAIEVGSESTSTPGQINTFVTQLLGVTLTQVSSVIGLDEEIDSDLRQRCRDALGALSPFGGKGAYAYFAKSATRSDGTAIGVNRVQVITTNDTGHVTVVVLTPSGVLSGGDLDDVEEKLQLNAVPACVTLTVVNATPVAVYIQYQVWGDASASASPAEVKVAIDLAIVNFLKSLPIGGTKKSIGQGLWVDKLNSVIASAHPAIIDVDTSGPPADVALTDYEFAQLSGDLALSTVTMVTQ